MVSSQATVQYSRNSSFSHYLVASPLDDRVEYRFQFLMIDNRRSRVHDRIGLWWFSCCKASFTQLGRLRSPLCFIGCYSDDGKSSSAV